MRSTLRLILCIATAAIIGCQSDNASKSAEVKPKPKPDWEWDGFAPSQTSHTIADVAYAQAAAGARADATLLPYHFDAAGKLNSLGIYRLDMIFSEPTELPPVLYMNWPTDDAQASARRASIEQWLKNDGIELDAVALKDGPNPALSGPAAANLARMSKTENPGLLDDSGGGSGGFDVGGMSPPPFQPGATSP